MTMPRDALDQIREIYFKASRATIEGDLLRAVTILKAMPEDQRERAAVFMEGLNEMRKEFRRAGRKPK